MFGQITRILRRARSRLTGEAGMSTVEYALGTIAAVALAGVLMKVVGSDAVETAMADLITEALEWR